MSKDFVLELLKENDEIMKILDIIYDLNLNEGCLCAGTIRNYIWNRLSQESNYIGDVDIAFYDKDISYEESLEIEKVLKEKHPKYDWEVRNQYHMHLHNNVKPYINVEDALSRFPERCTAIGARKTDDGYELIAPYGVEDILNFEVRPTPSVKESVRQFANYSERVKKKNWISYWDRIKIYY